MSKEQPGRHLAPGDMAAMIDGKLGKDEQAALVHHLAECEECRDLLGEYARAASAVETTHRVGGKRAMIWLSIAATLTLATATGVLMTRRQPPRPAAPSAGTTPGTTAPPAAPAPSTPAVVTPPVEPPTEDLTTRRSGTREIGGKTFKLVAGEWIDSAYDPFALLPTRDVDPATREDVLTRIPALRAYAALGPRLTVVHDGVVYRFAPR